MASVYRCRGYRKWCERRCDRTQMVMPPHYPSVGFYCALHAYQAPAVGDDGFLRFESEAIETHMRRRTSFLAPEATTAVAMTKYPGLLELNDAAKMKTATGSALVDYLRKSQGLSAERAGAYAQRMLDLEFIVAVSGSSRFRPDASAYAIPTHDIGHGH